MLVVSSASAIGDLSCFVTNHVSFQTEQGSGTLHARCYVISLAAASAVLRVCRNYSIFRKKQ